MMDGQAQDISPIPWNLIYRGSIILLAGVVLLVNLPSLLPVLNFWLDGLLLVVFIALQAVFTTKILGQRAPAWSLITLVSGYGYGLAFTAWGVVLGMGVGYFLRRWVQSPWENRIPKNPYPWQTAGFQAAMQILALAVATWLKGTLSGISGAAIVADGYGLLYLLAFTCVHSVLFMLDALFQRMGDIFKRRREMVLWGLYEFSPMPVAYLAMAGMPVLQEGALIAAGVAALLLGYYLDRTNRLRNELQRQRLELITLRQVSQVLHSTTDLGKLLSIIHLQIRDLLNVDNFYVALHVSDDSLLWYPLAIKGGVRQEWPARPLADRLTDRVILERKPILYNPEPSDSPAYISLPPSTATPTTWMGVPLIASNRAIGCLAVFSVTQDVRFTWEDLELFVTFSGQVGVAIENALMYEQAQRRASQQATLNRLNTLVTASLDPQQVLAQVCHAAVQVSGARHSTIYLSDPQGNRLWLAHAQGLSQEFADQNESYLLTSHERTRCMRTGLPVLWSEVSGLITEKEWLSSLEREGLRAYGDFPLITPDHKLGMLSIYFDTAHKFHGDEIEILQHVATQAALAVSNARLHANTDLALTQRARQVDILGAMGRNLSAAIHSERLFEVILNDARRYTNSPWGSLVLVNPEGDRIEIKAHAGYQNLQPYYPIDQGIFGRVIRQQQVVVIGDVRNDPDYIDFTGGGARSQIGVPLIYQDQVLGVLCLESQLPDGFSTSDQAFILQMADQAAIAVSNATLYHKIAQGHEHLAAVINSVNEGIVLIDPQGSIAIVNQAIADFVGLPPDELAGNEFVRLPQSILNSFCYSLAEAQWMIGALQQGQALPVDRIVYQDSNERYLERLSAPVWSQEQKLIGWMIILRDITEERQVAQARELITETLVHDLRSPLGAVLAALDFAEKELSQDNFLTDTVGQALQIARKSGKRIWEMVESLMEMSRLQSGTMDLELTPINLPIFITGVLDEFSSQAAEADILLLNQIPDNLPSVMADPSKLARVMANLIDNAIKFTPAQGRIAVTANLHQDEMVAIQVCDNGPGVPVEFRQAIFERFTQVPGQRGRRRGFGLGLAFCKYVVEAHGGHIWVDTSPGGGSAFTFTIPAHRMKTDDSDSVGFGNGL